MLWYGNMHNCFAIKCIFLLMYLDFMWLLISQNYTGTRHIDTNSLAHGLLKQVNWLEITMWRTWRCVFSPGSPLNSSTLTMAVKSLSTSPIMIPEPLNRSLYGSYKWGRTEIKRGQEEGKRALTTGYERMSRFIGSFAAIYDCMAKLFS